MMKTCHECGTEIKNTANFCEHCGAACRQQCDQCGTELNSTANYCSHCGAARRGSDRVDTAAMFYGMAFKDIYHKILELTPEGVRIHREKCWLWSGFDVLVPYEEITGLPLRKPSFTSPSGCMGVVFGEVPDPTVYFGMKKGVAAELMEYPFCVCFRRMKQIKPVYEALLLIIADRRR